MNSSLLSTWYRPLTPFDPPLTPFDPPFKCNYLIDYNLESKIVHPHIGLIPYLYACAKIGSDSYAVELEISIICLMKQTNFHFWSPTENGKKSCRGCKLLQIVLALLKKSKSPHLLMKFCQNREISNSHRSKKGGSKGVRVANMLVLYVLVDQKASILIYYKKSKENFFQINFSC